MSKPLYDAVVYDLDGTLIDSIPLIMDSFHRAYERVMGACPRTDEDIMSYIGKPLATTFECHDEATAKALVDAYLDHNEALLEENAVPLIPGVRQMLSDIENMGCPQALVTSKREHAARITLDLLELNPYFEVFVFAEDTKHSKPAADPLVECARRMGISDFSKILYVGDAMPDFLCAQNAGADFAFVGWSKMPAAEQNEIKKASPKWQPLTPKALSCIIGGCEL